MDDQFIKSFQDRLWDFYQVENISAFDKSYPRLLFIAKQCTKANRILNIGVGSGYLEEQLIRCGLDIYSLDPSKNAIETIKKKLHLGEKAQVGYSDNIPFESNTFDIVIMSEVLEHLNSDSLVSSLSEVQRVLNYRGIFIGTVPYKENFDESTIFCPHCGSVFHRWGHVQSFDKQSIRNLLESAGFKKISLTVRAFPDWNRKGVKSSLKSLMRYTLGRLGAEVINPNIYFKAYKD